MEIIVPILKAFWKKVEKSDNQRIASQQPTPGIKEICDLAYIDDGTREHLLDIYYPQNTKETDALPVVIDIHGGGWMYGYKEINKYFCLKIASKGFLVASINYRLSDKVRFDEQVKDVFAALSWLSKNLCNYPADTENVFLVGDSAGGHLACVAAATNAEKDFQRDFGVEHCGFDFKAVGAISPAIDLVSPNPMMQMNLKVLLGKDYKKSKFYKYMNFSNIATYKLPPFYIVTSNGDFIGKQAFRLKEILTEYGVENMFENYTQLLDGKKLQHVFAVVNPYSEPGEKMIDTMLAFFKAKIK